MLPDKVKLRTLLIGFSAGGIFLSSILILTSFTILQKSNIEKSLLESNLAYAKKLAVSVDRHLTNAQREIEWSAGQIDELKENATVRKEIDRLKSSSGYFNSVALMSSERAIVYASPEELNTEGLIVQSKNSRDATVLQKPLISDPFITSAGNYAIVISCPVYSRKKRYIGYIGGTIYLRKKSMLSEILSQHFYDKNTEVSIISDDGEGIFSEKKDSIEEQLISDREVKKNIIMYKTGHLQNNSGYLIGYARMTKNDWTVFITTAPENVRDSLMIMLMDSFWIMLSIIIFMVLIGVYIARRISSPLEKLAKATRSEDPSDTLAVLPEINTWYAEAVELREAVHQHVLMMLTRVNSLWEQAMTDPLTGILNRRGFDKMAAVYDHIPLRSVIAIDIDHFKRVNDTFGHEAGDAVLVSLAVLLKNLCRSQDVISRFGGEEFIILLPDTALKETRTIAEHIREKVEATQFPFACRITISAGIAGDDEINALLKHADEALYKAKKEGRNKIVLWE